MDGLRAIAVLAVLGYHAQVPHTQGGFLAISLFFTLSGFLITALLLRSGERGSMPLRAFWTSRFRRLLPAATLGLLLAVVFGATVASAQQASDLPPQIVAAGTYLSNWYFIYTDQSYVGLFSAPSPVQHYWSLAVEEQFYLLLPLVLVALGAVRRSFVAMVVFFDGGALASTAWMIHLSGSGASLDRIYYGTDTRMAELLVGGLLAVVLHRVGMAVPRRAARLLGLAGAGALLVALWAISSVPLSTSWLWRGGMFLFACTSSVVILGILAASGPLQGLGVRPLRYVGRISYGLYLYHWPLFLWLTEERTGLGVWPLFAVRVAATFVLAVASYHLVEMPIRAGRYRFARGRRGVVLAPLTVLAVFVAGFTLTDGDAPDRFETLRAGDSTLTAPVTPEDGVLEILAVADANGAPVIERLEDLVVDDPVVSVAVAPPFDCDRLVSGPGGRVCANWADTWPDLIEAHNPDVILFLVDDWAQRDLEAMVGDGETSTALATEVLGSGFDLLSSRGSVVLWATSGADLATRIFRSGQPLASAMADLEATRSDIRHVLGGRIPDPATVSGDDYLDLSAAALLADASLYQRASNDRLTRVLVIGDSQARSLGYGLERWGAQTDRALVWNVATEACGLTVDGKVTGVVGEVPVPDRCKTAVEAWPGMVESFDPDLVVILSSIWDTQDRVLPGSTEKVSLGDPDLDAYLADTLDATVDTFADRGVPIVWMTAPCTKFEPLPGQPAVLPPAFEPELADTLNAEFLEPLAARRPDDVKLFDLDAALCPDGSYRNTMDGVEEVRVDGVHFSVPGAAWFAETYGEEILGLWDR